MKRVRTSKGDLKTRKLTKEAKAIARCKKNSDYRMVDGIELPPGAILANWASLEHNHATFPEITYPRIYADRAFICRDCGSQEIWTAPQQKWWYEEAKGSIDSVAIRCRDCRKRESSYQRRTRGSAGRFASQTTEKWSLISHDSHLTIHSSRLRFAARLNSSVRFFSSHGKWNGKHIKQETLSKCILLVAVTNIIIFRNFKILSFASI